MAERKSGIGYGVWKVHLTAYKQSSYFGVGAFIYIELPAEGVGEGAFLKTKTESVKDSVKCYMKEWFLG